MEEVRNVKDPKEIFRDIKESQLLISWKLVTNNMCDTQCP